MTAIATDLAALADVAPPIGRLTLDDHRRIVAADPAFLEIFCCASEDVVGSLLDDLFTRRDRAGSARYAELILGYQGGWVDVLVAVRIAGRDHYVRLRMRRAGERWVAFVEDVGVQGDAVHELVLQREHWGAAVNSSTDGVAILDQDSVILDHNPRFLELMSFRSRHGIPLNEESISRKRFFSLAEGDAFAPIEAALAAPKAKSRRFSGLVHYGGMKLQVELRPAVVSGLGFVGACLIVRDKSAEEAVANLEIAQLQIRSARAAGMAEIATSVLHNIGNALNSVSVSLEVLNGLAARSRVDSLARVVGLLDQHAGDLGGFLTRDPVGAQVPAFLRALASHVSGERTAAMKELSELAHRMEHLKSIVRSQQQHARRTHLVERVNLAKLVDDAITMSSASADGAVELVRRYEATDRILVDPQQVMQILVNLLTNAKQAVLSREDPDRRIVVRVGSAEPTRAVVEVEDNGVGIPAENLSRIFGHGFTTKAHGHGFGLHGSALIAAQLGGSLSVRSNGPGLGAVFTLVLPANPGDARGQSANESTV